MLINLNTKMDFTSTLPIKQIAVPMSLPIFFCDLNSYAHELQLAQQACKELQVTHPESTPSNVKSVYSSPYKSHLLNPKLIPITQVVQKIAKRVSKETLSCDLDSINVDLFTTDCWCATYENSDHTIPHNHFPSDFSAVVYLEVNSDSAPIVFANSVAINPTPGSMVLFPGILNHHVPQTLGRRVVVAMNLFKFARFSNSA